MIRPARIRPADRVATQSDKTPVAQVFTFGAPVGGLVTNAPLSAGAGAVVLDNFWPTPQGISPRGGIVPWCSIPTKVARLMQYRAGLEYIAANDTQIFLFNEASSGALTASVSGQTSGNYASYEAQTSGGSFLIMVNGADKMRTYNGTTFQQVTGVSTPLAVTGIDTALLKHVWGHRNRVFFIERNSMRAWYLGVNSVAGAATVLPLTSIFRKGGVLEFGGTWSSDSGDGSDDRCVFVSSAGEVAVYSGSDPGNVANWSLDGVYDIGETLGFAAVTQVGGDLLIGNVSGLTPMSGVVQRDPAQLKSVSIAENIAPDWVSSVGMGARDWRITKWNKNSMLVAAPLSSSGAADVFVSNLETGAWARISGWRVGDIEALGDGLALGSPSGQIFRAWSGGQDNGQPFVCRACLKFEAFGSPAAMKVAGAMQQVWKTRGTINPQGSIAVDYNPKFPSAPAAASVADEAVAVWDVADWDDKFWARPDDSYDIFAKWRGLSGRGFAFAPQVQITSGTTTKIEAILERIDLSYMAGGAIT